MIDESKAQRFVSDKEINECVQKVYSYLEPLTKFEKQMVLLFLMDRCELKLALINTDQVSRAVTKAETALDKAFDMIKGRE